MLKAITIGHIYLFLFLRPLSKFQRTAAEGFTKALAEIAGPAKPGLKADFGHRHIRVPQQLKAVAQPILNQIGVRALIHIFLENLAAAGLAHIACHRDLLEADFLLVVFLNICYHVF